MGAQRKTLALLTLLAASRSQGISRERLAAYLWPESDTERARGALKQALHVVRRQLGSPEVILGTSELRLNPSYIESDVGAFLGALEDGNLELAARLYSGPFLDGFHLPGAPEFEQWVSVQRDEFARRYASAVERLASDADARGDSEAAIPWLRRLQSTDPFSARVTLRLMRALDAAGERVAALRCAQVHEALLREELDSPPDPEIAVLAAHLREESVRRIKPREPTYSPPSVSAPSQDAPTPLGSAPAEAPSPVRPEERRHTFRTSHFAAALVVFAAVILAVALFVADQRGGPEDEAPGVSADQSVAVLPFANASGDSATNHLSDGITDELTDALSRVEGLRVAPRTVTSALKRQGLDLGKIADTLGVAAVVEGAVHRDADRLKVNAQLVRAHDRTVLWSETYDREPTEFLAVQEEIARAIVRALYPQRSASERAVLIRPRTTDTEAYDLYMRGRNKWRQRTRDGLQQAVVFFEEAIERDPTFAMAHAGLAATYVNLSNFGYLNPGEALARAEVAADRALAIDPLLVEGHATKGFVLASRLEFEAAEAAFQRAIKLNPNFSWAHHYYTLLLLMMGRTNEALEQNRQALATEPLSLPANATQGIILLQRGDYPAADRELQRALTLSPNFQLTQYYLGVVRAALGRDADAGQLLERAAQQAPDFTGIPGARAFVFQRTGRRQAADSLLRDIETQAREGDNRARVNLAFAYAALGRMDAAFTLFDQVQWDVPSVIELRADPLLRPMRADPRYPSLLQKIGADQ